MTRRTISLAETMTDVIEIPWEMEGNAQSSHWVRISSCESARRADDRDRDFLRALFLERSNKVLALAMAMWSQLRHRVNGLL